MPQNKLKRGRRRLSRAGADSGPGTPLGAGAIGRWTGKRILNSTNRLPPNAAEDPIPVFKCNIPVLRCIFDLIHRCANVCGPTRIEDNCGGDRGAGDAVGVDARPVLGAETRCVAFELGVFALGVRLLVQDDAEDVPLDAFHHVVEACLPLPQAVDLSLGERRLALAVGQELRHAIALSFAASRAAWKSARYYFAMPYCSSILKNTSGSSSSQTESSAVSMTRSSRPGASIAKSVMRSSPLWPVVISRICVAPISAAVSRTEALA